MKLNIEIKTHDKDQIRSIIERIANDVESDLLAYKNNGRAIISADIGVVVDGDLVGHYRMEED